MEYGIKHSTDSFQDNIERDTRTTRAAELYSVYAALVGFSVTNTKYEI